MAIRMAPLPEGTRVKVVRGAAPQDPSLTGRTGVVVSASEYRPNQLGVMVDGEPVVRFFLPDEVVVTRDLPAPPERELAKQRKALP